LTEWHLRDEILELSHRWYLISLAFFIGSLLGWLASMLLPTTYRAEIPLYVAYSADAFYRNPDDYKNWQMQQLNDLTTTDDILAETLVRLGAIEPYWQQVQINQLRDMTRVLWRNTGKWRLVIEHPVPAYGVQAVETWTTVFLEYYTRARSNAIYQFEVDKLMQANANAQTQIELQIQNLETVRLSALEWQTSLQQMTAEALDEQAHQNLLISLSLVEGPTLAWEAFINRVPPAQAAPAEYLAWLETGPALLEADIRLKQQQLDLLKQEYASLNQQFTEVTLASRGLSANLEVDREYIAPVVPEAIRPTSLTVLVGGVLGSMLWVLAWLIPPFRRVWIGQ
jgi:hypothetical protein